MEWSLGQMVISKQGRDVGTVYVVVKIEDHFCYTADGRKTTYLNPKKKNIKHLQGTHRVSETIKETLLNGKIPSDLEIREFLNHHRSEN
ncbi:MAG: KOW domain-containing RNA-binding protein [Firmicutes bacterium]|nr:KOW domain-containing RNA-binding protein [Bacillota bacterium]